MACLGSIGADEADAVVGAQNGAFLAVVLNSAVEEDHGHVAGHGDDLVGNVGGAGGDHVDDQQVAAILQSGVDGLVLGGLAVVAVIVGEVDAQGAQLSVQSGADRRNVGISVGVVEHADLQGAGLGGSLGSGSLSGGGLSSGCAGAAASGQSEHHGQSQNKCK